MALTQECVLSNLYVYIVKRNSVHINNMSCTSLNGLRTLNWHLINLLHLIKGHFTLSVQSKYSSQKKCSFWSYFIVGYSIFIEKSHRFRNALYEYWILDRKKDSLIKSIDT